MKAIITGGAGFIGRWVVKKLLEKGIEVSVLDNLSTGSERNLEGLNIKKLFKGDICNKSIIDEAFNTNYDLCIHLAAHTCVQDSIDHPKNSVDVNVNGTFNILEAARKNNTKVVVVGSCMVYDLTDIDKPITEEHPTNPLSPYAATKLAADKLALSYYYSYELPVVIVRPFNTYGPFQETEIWGNLELGAIPWFTYANIKGENLKIYGDGSQTRDFLYVEDCADFIIKAAFSEKSVGKIINAGTGKDISIKDLALMITKDKNRIKHIPHHHPQSEIWKMVGNYSKAKSLLGWEPKTSLKEGLKLTEQWVKEKVKNEKSNTTCDCTASR